MNLEASEQSIDLQLELNQFVEQIQTVESVQEHVEAFRKMADIIQQELPTVPDEYIRLWRANRVGEVGKNPSYTTSLEGIALPFLVAYKGPLSFVDVPADLLPEYATSGATNDDGTPAEYILPIEYLGNAQIVGLSKEESSAIMSTSLDKPENTGSWDFV
jgi:hypothetical protein